jgi:uncharacterized protein (TIGR03086 family)
MTTIADRYRRLAARLTEVVAAVPADAWDQLSPCEGWTSRDVLAHVVTTEWQFLRDRGFAPEGVTVDGDPVAAWSVARDAVSAVLDDPSRAGIEYDGWFGRTTVEATIDRFYAFDLVIHAWDLARAAGLRELEALPDDEVARIRADAESMGPALRTPGVCGPERDAPEGADAQTRLLAYLGREV